MIAQGDLDGADRTSLAALERPRRKLTIRAAPEETAPP
jgi:hypothetical protein